MAASGYNFGIDGTYELATCLNLNGDPTSSSSSYNNEGFIAYNEMLSMLKEFGTVISNTIKYYAFKGSRNLKKRKKHTKEYLFLLEKN